MVQERLIALTRWRQSQIKLDLGLSFNVNITIEHSLESLELLLLDEGRWYKPVKYSHLILYHVLLMATSTAIALMSVGLLLLLCFLLNNV